MAASRFFGKPLVAQFIARQRHTAGHVATLAAAEHGDLPAEFAVAGGNGAGVAVFSARDGDTDLGKLANRNEGLNWGAYRGRLPRLARATTGTRSRYGYCVVRWRCCVCVAAGPKIQCQRALKIPA